MKKKVFVYILKAFIFSLLLVCLLVHYSYAVRPELSHTRRNINGYYAEPRNSLDVVFVGSSGTMSAFLPVIAYRDFGFASYNFCTNETAYEAFPYCVKEALKTQKPDVLMIDIKTLVRPCSINGMLANNEEGNIRFNTDAFKWSPDRLEFMWRFLPHTSDYLPYFFDILKYHDQPFDPANWDCADHFINRGFNFLGWGHDISYLDMTDEVLPVSEGVENAFNEIVEICRNADPDVQVVFFYYPYAGPVAYTDTPLEFVNYLGQRTEEEGFTFLNCLDYFDEFDFDVERDYWNNGHWSINGAEKITAWMGAYLTEHYDLPDHRGDAAYSQWEADIAPFEELCRAEHEKVSGYINAYLATKES